MNAMLADVIDGRYYCNFFWQRLGVQLGESGRIWIYGHPS
jgi:hypothetical protein